VSLGLQAVRNFSTLRDQHHINEIDVSQLITVRKLGEGGFAVVEECLYSPPSGIDPYPVAVKKLKPAAVDSAIDMDSFVAEIALMRKLAHKSIVEYIGLGFEDNSSDRSRLETMFLVSELMDGGTLKKLVLAQMCHPEALLYSHQDALRWCIQIAEALAYLHAASPMVIHRDLKPENILLKGKDSGSKSAKLADFGLVAFVGNKRGSTPPLQELSPKVEHKAEKEYMAASRAYLSQLNRRSSRSFVSMNNLFARGSRPAVAKGPVDLPKSKARLSGMTGTLMYMAPEMYKNEQYDEKVDVFSFALVMYEVTHKFLMVGTLPITEEPGEEVQRYAQRVSNGFRLPLSKQFPQQLRTLIADCWAQDPRQRPSMKEVVGRLRDIQSSGLMPPDVRQGGCCVMC